MIEATVPPEDASRGLLSLGPDQINLPINLLGGWFPMHQSILPMTMDICCLNWKGLLAYLRQRLERFSHWLTFKSRVDKYFEK